MKLLFERLSKSHAGRDTRIPELRDSVIAEVARILSSRSYPGLQAGPGGAELPLSRKPDPGAWDIFQCGIPRSVDFFGASSTDLSQYQTAIRRAISRGEPRLKKLKVEVEPPRKPYDPAVVSISGELASDSDRQWVHFSVDMAPR